MQEQERRWQNQYIDLITKQPDYIVAGTSCSLSEEQIELVRRRSAPYAELFCELCSGSGGHLVELAAARPDAFFVGFELRFKRTFNTAKKAQRLDLKNLMVVRTNAELLGDVFPPQSLGGVYINFPDPWARERWKKHRILRPDFLDVLATRIKAGGFLSYKTDHEEYFTSTLELLAAHPNYAVRRQSRNLHAEPAPESKVKTEFERLFISKGQPIFFLEAEIVR